MSDVLYAREDAIAIITLNRPHRLNAFSAGLRDELYDAIARAEADTSAKAVVIEGAGASFSAGADLTEQVPDDFDAGAEIDRVIKPVLERIAGSDKPYVAAANGAVAGVGCGLALACDLVVMATDAYLLFAFSSIGLAPDGGTSWQLLRQVGHRVAFDLLTGGERIPAERCLTLGLANQLVAPEELAAAARARAHGLAAKPTLGIAFAKRALRQACDVDLGTAISLEAALQAEAMRGADFQAARRAFNARKSA